MINRKLKDGGIEPLLAYIILLIVFLGFSFYLFNKTTFAEYIYLLLALTFIGNLSEIRRTEFLKICFSDNQLRKIRISENLICSIPFLTFLLYKQLYFSSSLLLALTIILALINFRTSINFSIWTPFSKRPFEFTTGFRNSFYMFFIAYSLTFIAVSVDNFNLGVFAMLLVIATTLTYYTKPEQEYYVWIFNMNTKKFLFTKIKTALLFSASLALPILIVLSIYYPQYIGILWLFFLVGWAFLISITLSKYSAYPYDMNIAQGIILALCIWFPPLLLVLIPYLFKKSENRLRSLLK